MTPEIDVILNFLAEYFPQFREIVFDDIRHLLTGFLGNQVSVVETGKL
jgi:hypothetical protein